MNTNKRKDRVTEAIHNLGILLVFFGAFFLYLGVLSILGAVFS